MIVRNLVKFHLENCLTTKESLRYMPLSLSNRASGAKYFFSDQPDKDNKDNNEKDSERKKQMRYKNVNLLDRFFLKRILNSGTGNARFYKKMLLYSDILRSKKPNLPYKVQGSYLFTFLIFILLSFVITRFKKSPENPEVIKIEQQINLAESQLKGSKKLEQIISKINKIYIESSFIVNKYIPADKSKQLKERHEVQHAKKITSYKIRMQDKEGNVYVADPYQGDPNNFLKFVELVQQKYQTVDKADVFFQSNEQYYGITNAALNTLGFLTPFINVAIIVYLFRKTDPTTILKSFGKGVKEFKIEAMRDIKTRFSDVAGMEQAKKEITQFVDFLKHSRKYKQMGAKIPKGALLTGPPGTGKTMLARACAGQAGVSFFYISGSQFVQVFVGLGASKVRDLFAKARQNAPSIIFIDQIDAIGKKRENSRNEQKDTTLNQLLVEMDGFSSNQTIIILAATNRKEILDNALTRPGRFDRMVEINLPDIKAREQIFMVHLAPLKIDPNVQMRTIAKRLAQLSPGFSGADIANLCNEAAIIATRKNRDYIEDKDFEEATERITAGYVKKNLMKQHIKKRVAYHESGHAVASWFLKGGDPLVKLTIIPRSKGALGYAQYLPKTSYIMARNEMIDKVAIMLGGITAEQVFFGQISSGGSDDLQKVYSLTRRMVTQFGMGQETYNVTIDEESYIQKESTFLTDKMEEEVSKILQEARKRSRQIIEQKRDLIKSLADQLIQKQTINGDEIVKVLGQRPVFQGESSPKKAELVV